MKSEKEVKISYWAHHLTTVVSVTLVLILLGIIALIWISADKETRRLKERIELSMVLTDSLPNGAGQMLVGEIKQKPYARQVRVISREEALKNWTEETGEDLQELFGVNPLSEEIVVSLNADYTSGAKIAQIVKELKSYPGVESVSSPDDEMIESMNRNISRITLILAMIAGIMLVISFVLINNTVHLSIYSRRFTIHTMQLVGATNGFIRRPVILNNMIAGLVAGVFAAIILAGIIFGAGESGLSQVINAIGWPALVIVVAALIATGVLICALASCYSANLYLRKDYDQLFK